MVWVIMVIERTHTSWGYTCQEGVLGGMSRTKSLILLVGAPHWQVSQVDTTVVTCVGGEESNGIRTKLGFYGAV